MNFDQLWESIKDKNVTISGYNHKGLYWDEQIPEMKKLDIDTDTATRSKKIVFSKLHGDTGVSSDKLSLTIFEKEVIEIKKGKDQIEINCGPSVIILHIK